jgi:hypothetical protein
MQAASPSKAPEASARTSGSMKGSQEKNIPSECAFPQNGTVYIRFRLDINKNVTMPSAGEHLISPANRSGRAPARAQGFVRSSELLGGDLSSPVVYSQFFFSISSSIL